MHSAYWFMTRPYGALRLSLNHQHKVPEVLLPCLRACLSHSVRAVLSQGDVWSPYIVIPQISGLHFPFFWNTCHPLCLFFSLYSILLSVFMLFLLLFMWAIKKSHKTNSILTLYINCRRLL